MELLEKLNIFFEGTIEEEFSGNSGKVYLVRHNEGTYPEYIAYKRCKELCDASLELFEEEVIKWNSINSQYIVPIYYVYKICDEYYACMRACDGSLENIMKEIISQTAAFNYSLQIIKGLIDLNKSNIKYHQDFNPQNILFEDLSRKFKSYPPNDYDISHKYRMMISDFAMSNYYKKNKIDGKCGGKFPFKAPEQYKNSNIIEFEPDRFSLGVLLCMLFSNQHPCGFLPSQILKKNPKKFSWECWANHGERIINVDNKIICNLIVRLLSKEPLERPDFKECFDVLKQEYFKFDFKQAEISIFQIDYFDKEHCEYPREKLKCKYVSGEFRIF